VSLRKTLKLFPILGPSSLPIVVAQFDERHANRTASVLEWYDKQRAYQYNIWFKRKRRLRPYSVLHVLVQCYSNFLTQHPGSDLTSCSAPVVPLLVQLNWKGYIQKKRGHLSRQISIAFLLENFVIEKYCRCSRVCNNAGSRDHSRHGQSGLGPSAPSNFS